MSGEPLSAHALARPRSGTGTGTGTGTWAEREGEARAERGFCGGRKLLCTLQALPMGAPLAELRAGHSVEWQPREKAAVGQGALQGALRGRVHLQLAQAGSPFATRYEKTVRNYAAVVAIGCALLWLRI